MAAYTEDHFDGEVAVLEKVEEMKKEEVEKEVKEVMKEATRIEHPYNLFMLITHLPIPRLSDIFRKEVLIFQIVYTKEGRQTNRTIMVTEKPYDFAYFENLGLTKQGKEHEMVITRYYLHRGHFPHEDQNWRFAIPTPSHFDMDFIEKEIKEKMKKMEVAGIIGEGSWKLLPPFYTNRLTGAMKNCRRIEFSPDVDKARLAVAMVALNGTSWPPYDGDQHRSAFEVRWENKTAKHPFNRDDETVRREKVPLLSAMSLLPLAVLSLPATWDL